MSQLWSITFNGSTLPNDGFIGSPALGADGTLYIAGAFADSANGNQRRLYAINGATGATLSGWPVYLGAHVNTASGLVADKGIESSPAIGPDGMIYIGSWNYNVYKINPLTRAVTSWSPTGTQPKGILRTAPILSNGLLYCWMDGDPLAIPSAQQPHLVILNASTMALVGSWVPLSGTYGDAISSPALGRNGMLYAATHYINGDDRVGHIYAIDVSNPSSPTASWSYPSFCIGAVVSSIVIDSEGKVYLSTQQGELDGVSLDGSLICFNPNLDSPWDPQWARDVGGTRPIDGTPAIAKDGSIYAPIDNGGSLSDFVSIYPQPQVDGGTLSSNGITTALTAMKNSTLRPFSAPTVQSL
jgi:outer membrane protein assembly factor BamB